MQRWPAAHAAPVVPQTQPRVASHVSERRSQATQAAPSAPQALVDTDGTHWLLSQQVSQATGLHWQVLPAHCCPTSHSAVDPQPQTPSTQASARIRSHAVHAFPPLPHVPVL